MKKILFVAASMLLVFTLAVPSFAAESKSKSTAGRAEGNFEIDGSFGFATGPGDFGSGVGFNFGAGYMLSDIDKNLQVRADMSYFDFSYTPAFYFSDLSYTRVPITVSARYYFPINDRLRVFAQAGLETSFDQKEYVDYIYGLKHSKNEVNFGLTPGAGIDFRVAPQISIFALGNLHIIYDSYFNTEFGAAFHF